MAVLARLATISNVGGKRRKPSKGGVQLSHEQTNLIAALSLLVAVTALAPATGSFITDLIGAFGSSRTAEEPPSAASSTEQASVARPAELLEFLRWQEHQTSLLAEQAQAEIEALAATQVTGDRSEIVERIKGLNIRKSAYETNARYYRQAIRQFTASH
ncbi:hypothetical protein [Nonomuraea wenchangensis]|uniref:hypothetical protein n=1 Tax=Nonomuraea wenchangensis TaxID=568860 RepID=UPI00116060AD|nr:hypothetical protein [Nonomuraea wenchangensis]